MQTHVCKERKGKRSLDGKESLYFSLERKGQRGKDRKESTAR